MSSSLIYTTAVSATVATLVASVFRWGGYWASRIRSRFTADHRPLYAADWQLGTNFMDTHRLRVLAVCAPSRSLRSTEIDPDAAIAFVRSQFGAEFPSEPHRSFPQSGVQFEGATGAAEVPYVWVWTGGRVDYCTFVDLASAEDGRLSISALDVVTPIAALAAAVTSSSYRDVFPRRRFELPRRFDWFLAVATRVRRGEQTIQWDEVSFPGASPPRAGGKQQAYCPPDGFARKALTSWKPRRPVDRLVAVFLDSFLKQNGYHSCDEAIACVASSLLPDRDC
jgi:hypothetical protein